jgi:glycine cleavage system H lipoate-binding protein
MRLVYYAKSEIPTWFRKNDMDCEVGTSKLPENVWSIRTQPDGFRLRQGRIFAILEFFFFSVPLHSPISGKIIAINDEVKTNPSLLYENPLGNWIIKVKLNESNSNLKSNELKHPT